VASKKGVTALAKGVFALAAGEVFVVDCTHIGWCVIASGVGTRPCVRVTDLAMRCFVNLVNKRMARLR